MIGYEIGTSSAEVLHDNQDFSDGGLQAWMENDTDANMTTPFAKGEGSPEVEFLGQPQTLRK